MPTIVRKHKTIKHTELPERAGLIDFTACLSAGCLLGLSAPGFNQWYLAWVGLVPLLLLSISSQNWKQAFSRGLLFGLGYNLVYLNWYLGLYPLNWLGFADWQAALLSIGAWFGVSLHQAFLIGVFSLLCHFLPARGSFVPEHVDGRWHWPAFLFVPLLWVAIENKIGNAPNLLGVPWSMIEYSQYQQLPLIQITGWIGGIGMGVLIVMANVAITCLLATLSRKPSWKKFAAKTSAHAVIYCLTLSLLITVIYCWGLTKISQQIPDNNLAVLQANINIDMQKSQHCITLTDLLTHYQSILKSCRTGICVLTESAIPAYLRKEPKLLNELGRMAKSKHLDLVIGSLDKDNLGHSYNSAFAINQSGELLSTIYHKRFLVPFGEYTPHLVQYMPEPIQRLTNTPAGHGFTSGTRPAILPLAKGSVAPLICFEVLSPELVASSVRMGGGLIVNLSDLAWFHSSMIGQQMLAFAVMRAVENQRYFVFAANSGPSAIVNPQGKIDCQSLVGQETVLNAKVSFRHQISPFCFWFR